MLTRALRVLVIDNYDSFTYNLVHYLEELVGSSVTVWRNDTFEPKDALHFDAIVLSPGPGLPSDSGRCMELITLVSGHIPLLGVCMGMQCLAVEAGGSLQNLETVQHGKATPITVLRKDALFNGVSGQPQVGRYHSWVVNATTLPACFEVLATDDDGHIMAIRKKGEATWGVQFHPESLLTPEGKQLLRNFLHQVEATLTVEENTGV